MTLKSQELRETANNQGGYFTARQAKVFGYDLRNAPYYVSSGEWIRESHGIYRLVGVPSPDPIKDELHFWLLWTIGRKANSPRGALAYETVLSLYELSDLIPSKVHLTVPRDFKISKIPKGVSLHFEEKSHDDFVDYEGLKVVRPLIAIIDLIREERVSMEHIERGFLDGVRKGVIAYTEIKDAELKPQEQRKINEWLREFDGKRKKI